MDSMKRLGLVALSLVLSVTLSPLASAAEAPALPALCMGSGTAPVIFKSDDTSCPASFCWNDDQCWSQCTQATSAACVSGICQYTLPGGGGSGPLNPPTGECPYQSFCSDDSQCYYSLGGIQGSCLGGTCHC
jgi:hypothetical protein